MSDAQVVLGKFAAAFTLVFVSLVFASLVLPVYMAYAAPAPACSRPSLYTGFAVVALFAAAWCAAGTLVSLLSPHPAAAALATAVLLDDHADVEAHQRPHIRRQAAIGGCHQDALPHTGHAHGDLLDTRVQCTSGGVDTLEQLDLLSAADHFQRVIRRI